MKVEEARCFAEKFYKSEYSESDHESFLEWVREASIDELGGIADYAEETLRDDHELLCPSQEWIAALEEKIDKFDRRNFQEPARNYARVRSRNIAYVLCIPVVLVVFWLFKSELVIRRSGPSYVTISTERGQQKEVKLWEGSVLWLNGGSSVRYCKTGGKEREIEMMGEAFFDVHSESSRPFVVKAGKIKVEVLGTQFDVRNYSTEGDCSIKVMDGKVKVTNGTAEAIVNAMQEARLIKGDLSAPGIVVSKFDDLVPLTLWGAGILQFRNENITKVVNELSVSFGLQFDGTGVLSKNRFTGTFSMDEPISEICERLQFVFTDIKFHCDSVSRVVVLKQ